MPLSSVFGTLMPPAATAMVWRRESLGRFLRGRRDGLIIATKYGLPANLLIEALLPIAEPFRAVRKLARQIGLTPRMPPKMTAAHFRQSIEQSLNALRVDVIDILFLHEPSLSRLPEPMDFLTEVARQKDRGTIRFIGLSGDYASVLGVAARHEGLADIVQVPEQQWQEEAYVPDLTFSSMRLGPQSRSENSPRSATGERTSEASAPSPPKRVGHCLDHAARSSAAPRLCCR